MNMPPGGYPDRPQDPDPQQPGGFPPPQQPGGFSSSPQPGGFPPPQQSGEFAAPQQPGGFLPPPQPGGFPPPQWPAKPSRNRAPLIIALVAVLAVVLSVTAWALSRGGNDPKEQAQKFMTAVQGGDFDGAKKLICKDGKGKFGDATELRQALIGTGQITGFTVGSVGDSTYQGDKRKDVEVSVQMGDGSTKSVTLSMTKESGKYLVCGF